MIDRMSRKGTHSYNRGRGAAVKFLRDNLGRTDETCLIWPFTKMPNGYGTLGYNGAHFYAHRFMCALLHGEAPTKKHEAAHSCGNGHGSCVHPKHLFWKTKSGNMQDRSAHGRAPNSWWGIRGKLTPENVKHIRDCIPLGPPMIHWLAAKYVVTPSNIRHIQQGRTWKPGARRPHNFTPEQLDDIRASSLSINELAAKYSVSRSCIVRIRTGKTFKRAEDRAA